MKPLIEFVQESDNITGVLILMAMGIGGICIAIIMEVIIDLWRYIMNKIKPENEILQFPVFPELIEYHGSLHESGIDTDEIEEEE